MTIKKEKVEKLFLSDDVVIDVTDEKIYNSGDGVTVNNDENKISADYAAISARLNNLSDPFTLSSQVASVVAAEALSPGSPSVALFNLNESEYTVSIL